VPDIDVSTHTTDELRVATSSQPLHWPWTLAFGAGLFVAVLAGLVMLPLGTPSVPAGTGSVESPVSQRTAANVASDTPSTEQTQVTPDDESTARQAAVPTPVIHRRVARRSVVRATPNLQPAVDAAPLPQPSESEAQETAPSSAAARRQEAAAARNQEPGMLRINSRPWAQVFVDGKPRGTTPQMGMAVNPGHHTVQLVNTPMGMSKTFPLDIQSAEIVTKVVNLIE
jgi:hypothetical protein